ncbi:hypothetical protein NFI96_025822 [Prochilodus magdalenae]|nr:hypothetical protein NFI96_025822 [Prochilodus magdalenae]
MRLFRSPPNTHCSSDEQNRNTELLYVPAGCTLSQTQEKPITRYPGESVLLPCSCTDPDTRPGSVKWERVDPGGTEGSSKMEIYSDRVQMFNQNHPSNLSLLISDLTEQDQGTYRCSINNKQSISIRLSITCCTLSQTQENQITRYPGESVLLPCSCTDPNTRPLSVKWEHVGSGGTEGSNCTLSQTQEEPITRYPGESVLLPCSCTDNQTRPLTVKWAMGGTEVSSKTAKYSDRVQMFNENHPANLSLLISNLTEQDQGTYRCSINTNQSRNISLSITGCTLSQTQENQIIRYPGQSVLLPCSCTDPNTRPLSVKWERVDSGGTEGSNKTEPDSDRVQMFNKIHPADLSLLISNLTEHDQGTYRCSINNNQSINIRLSITAGQQGDQTAEQGNWVIIIIICALLLILLLLVGGAACTYRKHVQGRKQRKDKDTGQRTNQADDDYENDPRNISMGPVYQSLDPRTNQSDSVYQSLNPKTNQSDSVYQSLNPKTNQSDSVYQSLNPKTNQSDSVYQSLNPKTNQSDSVYQSLDPKTNQSDSVYQSLNPKTNQSDSVYQSLDPKTN